MGQRDAMRSLSRIAALLMPLVGGSASAQNALPTITIGPAARHVAARHVAARRGPAASRQLASPSPPRPAEAAPAPVPAPAPAPQSSPAELTSQSRLDRLLPKIGVNQYSLDRAAIDALPQGNETPLDKVLLQAPGVAQDCRRQRQSARAQRTRQSPISHQRHPPARRGLGLRAGDGDRLHRLHVPHHRRAAGAIWTAHGRPRRHRLARAAGHPRRKRHDLRRQPRHRSNILRIWRQERSVGGLRDRAPGEEQPWPRKSDVEP